MDQRDIGGWGVQRLAELVERSLDDDGDVDWPRTLEGVAESLDAEVVAVVDDGRVVFSRGFRPGTAPASALADLVATGDRWIDLDGIGRCGAVGIAIPGRGQHLVLARRDDGFSAGEEVFLRAVVKLLALMNRLADAVDAERAASSHAVHQAGHDSLTGLSNRTTLIAELRQLSAELQRSRETAAVLFVDLDRFKLINDTAGHAVGDEVLKVTADRLRTSVRAGDTVARLAGDEFVVVCRDLGIDGGRRMADRIRDLLARPILCETGEVRVSASIGVAEFASRTDPETVVADADLAMYRAKQRGRNQVESFTPSLRTEMVARVQAAGELRRAIDQGQFRPVYQPVVDLETATILGFEALCRWVHPERGEIPAREFIPLAEESGLVTALDRLMVGLVLEQMRAWQGEHGDVVVSINLSAPNLADGTIVDLLGDSVRAAGIDPSLLWIEITESVAMGRDERSLAAARTLRDQGFFLVIDDFGTGYSSLAYLADLPVSSVKIDRAFVAGLGTHEAASAAIITAVAHVAAALGLTVVAEGVETDQQWDVLRSIQTSVPGITFLAQGWRFGRPVDAATASALLRRGLDLGVPAR